MKTKVEIHERLTEALEDLDESRKEDMNSYGAGYDAGFAAALRWVLDEDE